MTPTAARLQAGRPSTGLLGSCSMFLYNADPDAAFSIPLSQWLEHDASRRYLAYTLGWTVA